MYENGVALNSSSIWFNLINGIRRHAHEERSLLINSYPLDIHHRLGDLILTLLLFTEQQPYISFTLARKSSLEDSVIRLSVCE